MDPYLAPACFMVTLALYSLVKKIHIKAHKWWTVPLFLVPILLVVFLLITHIPYHTYFQDTRWLVWLLGPATVAFAIPIYEQRELIKRHWMTLMVGVIVGITVGMGSSVLLARLFGLPELLQRSLAPRSVSTPFAMAASPAMGGDPQLTAIFVVITGVVGMSLGELILVFMKVRSSLARGALFGAAAHGAGTAKACEIGSEEGVVASLTMMLCGIATVLLAPFIAMIL